MSHSTHKEPGDPRAARVSPVDARRRARQDLGRQAGRIWLEAWLARGGGGTGVGRFSTAPLSEGPNATSDPHRLARSVYGVAQGRGTTSLRVLDFGVIGAAWLLAFLAGFAGDAPFGVRGFIPYLLIPIVTQLFVNQVDGPLRTGLALRVGRGSGARRRRRVRRHLRVDVRARVVRRPAAHDAAAPHRAAGRGAADPPRLRRHPVPGPPVRARASARRQDARGCAR